MSGYQWQSMIIKSTEEINKPVNMPDAGVFTPLWEFTAVLKNWYSSLIIDLPCII